MCREVESCRVEDDLNRPAQLMWELDIGSVPVVEGAGEVIGMITDRDVCMAAYTRGLPLSAIRVGEVMSRDLESCAPGTSAEVALSIMMEARVRRLPVIHPEDGLVGILSLCDFAQAADRARRLGERQPSADLTEALARISGRRSASAEIVARVPAEPPVRTPSKRVSASAR